MKAFNFKSSMPVRFLLKNARLTLSVEGDNIPPEQLEARLQIVPLSGILDVRVTDLDDPVSVGESAGVYRSRGKPRLAPGA